MLEDAIKKIERACEVGAQLGDAQAKGAGKGKHAVTRRAAFAVAGATAAYVLAPRFSRPHAAALFRLGLVPDYAYADTLPDQIVNGSFNYPGGMFPWKPNCNWAVFSHDGYIYDPNYEKGRFGTRRYSRGAGRYWWWEYSGMSWDPAQFGWRSDQWDTVDSPNDPDSPNEGIPGGVEIQKERNGNFCAEIIAGVEGCAIYQDVSSRPGAVMKWKLWHSAQWQGATDWMQVMIGPPGGCAAQPCMRDDGSDRGMYVHDYAMHGTFEHCYDNDSDWHVWRGVYRVPNGQTVTRFSFRDASGRVHETVGNVIDGVSFYTVYPLFYDPNGSPVAVPEPWADGYECSQYYDKWDRPRLASWDGSYRASSGGEGVNGRYFEYKGWTEARTDGHGHGRAHAAVIAPAAGGYIDGSGDAAAAKWRNTVTSHIVKGEPGGSKDLYIAGNESCPWYDVLFASYIRRPVATFKEAARFGGETVKTGEVPYGGAASGPDLEHRFWLFDGWTVLEGESEPDPGNVDAVYDDIVLQAGWRMDPDHPRFQVVYHVDESAWSDLATDDWTAHPTVDRMMVKTDWAQGAQGTWVRRTCSSNLVIDVPALNDYYAREAKRDGHDEDHALCTRADGSDGFDGWYLDPGFRNRFSSWTWDENTTTTQVLNLYARNIGHVEFTSCTVCDDGSPVPDPPYISEQLPQGGALDEAAVMPAAVEAAFGSSVNLPGIGAAVVYYDQGGARFDRPLYPGAGWVGSPASHDTGSSRIARFVQDVTLYKPWRATTYDGVESHSEQDG